MIFYQTLRSFWNETIEPDTVHTPDSAAAGDEEDD